MTTTTTTRPSTPRSTSRPRATQWETAAEAWHRWGPTLRSWLGAGDRADARPRAASAPGCRVLDVAAGAGDQTLQAAARVGPGGSVLATDISPAILAFAAAEAKRAGLRERRDARHGRRAPRARPTRRSTS